MTTPLLSICIATYNRGPFIAETLDSIIAQLTNQVELLVVDGASTDNTEEVLKEYAAKGVRYIRLPQKGGVDQDFCKAVELARGTYCWLFADDDLFLPGAIARVLQELEKGHSLVIANAEVRNCDFSVRFPAMMMGNAHDETYQPGDLEGLFLRVVPGITFIGCVIIERELWLNREHERFFGTEFIHVGVIFQEQLPGTAFVIANPCVSIRYGNAQWSGRGFEIWMQKWPRLIWSFPLISKEAKHKKVSPEPWKRLKTLRLSRALGSYTPEMYEKIIAPSSASPLWKWAARTIARLPHSPWNAFIYWYTKTFKNKPRKQMMIYDLSLVRQKLDSEK